MEEYKNWVGKNNKALMVVRVSSSGQEGNNSHTYQTEDGLRYANRNQLNLVETIQIVESAKQSNLRTEYHAAIRKALKQGIQHILFYKIDREARNLTDSESNEKLVREGKVVIHYVAEGRILHKNSPDSDFLMRDFQAVQDKHYSRDLSSKITRAQLAKAESGWSPVCQPPMGYINEKLKTEKGFERRRGSIIVPDNNKFNVKLVQREFELRASNSMPYEIIRKTIISEGLIPIDQIGKYNTSSIERRLKNPFYDGRFIWDGVEYAGKHERIIPAEIFGKVQETFGLRNPYGKKAGGVFQNGWIKCADPACGCHVIFDPRKKHIKATGEEKTYRHYRCTNGKKVHVTTKGMRVTEEQLIDQFSQAIEEIDILPDFANELLAALNESKEKARRAIKQDISNFSMALKTLEGAEDDLYKDLRRGILDEEGYHRQIASVRSERTRFTNLLEKAQLHINDITGETFKSILQLATDVKSLWKNQSDEERAGLLNKLLSNQVLDGATVRYQLILPLRVLLDMKGNSDWRRERDLNPR